jgi:hypothetical protein
MLLIGFAIMGAAPYRRRFYAAFSSHIGSLSFDAGSRSRLRRNG